MKNKPILFSGIIVAIIIFQTELSGFSRMWNPKPEPPHNIQNVTGQPVGTTFEKRKPLHRNCFIKLYKSPTKIY